MCISYVTSCQFNEENTRESSFDVGHGFCSTSKHNDTGMIFIPSLIGLSHKYNECSFPEKIKNAFKILLKSVAKQDDLRRKKGF
ncbi:hypothetical protein ZYGR_0E00140 [Zygosaccharomyces rouxii]|uniref:ZYRO0B00286p n=2 Tax=Zygosaccharomyces rouxii TaxID=4956 RepID=C5DQH7_ZYGRC|nr:uncharacterized protein ZYRO0B00286g [Zygosaccharomyces rouxii]GAV47006.1 hypothetical protein ZYGR_0E00140 [Zygosaccharomyces rouxii]CAR26038.1 ZYRO0B00286p [Zygosaccharomyces rouxii]